MCDVVLPWVVLNSLCVCVCWGWGLGQKMCDGVLWKKPSLAPHPLSLWCTSVKIVFASAGLVFARHMVHALKGIILKYSRYHTPFEMIFHVEIFSARARYASGSYFLFAAQCSRKLWRPATCFAGSLCQRRWGDSVLLRMAQKSESRQLRAPHFQIWAGFELLPVRWGVYSGAVRQLPFLARKRSLFQNLSSSKPSFWIILLFAIAESVQTSLERIFGKGGGRIPVTPSDSFEKRMGVSTCTSLHELLRTTVFNELVPLGELDSVLSSSLSSGAS